MSKKKNTLKDLDEFLRQQASTLVEPSALGETVQRPHAEPISTPVTADVNADTILDQLKTLATRQGSDYKITLCKLIIDSLGSKPTTSAEEKMLINTALYLSNTSDWKEAIKNYWEKH